MKFQRIQDLIPISIIRKLVKFFISVSVLILIMKQDLVIFQLKC